MSMPNAMTPDNRPGSGRRLVGAVRSGIFDERRRAVRLTAMRLSAPISAIAVQALLLRVIGLGGLGTYALLNTAVGLLAIIGSRGAPHTLSRRLAVTAERSRAVALYRAANVSVLRWSVALAVGFAVLGPTILEAAGAEVGYPAAVLVGLLAVVLASQSVFVGASRGLDRLTAATGVDLLLGRILMAAFLVVAWTAAWDIGLSGALLALLVSTLLSVAAGLWWVWRDDLRSVWRSDAVVADAPSANVSDRSQVEADDTSANPVLLVNHVVLFVAGIVGIWILHRSIGPEETGTFHLANRLALIAGIPGVVAQFLLGPKLARAAAEDRLAAMVPTIRRHVGLASLITAGLGLAIVAIGPAMLGVVAGDQLTSSVIGPLAILLAGQLFHVATGPCGYSLIMAGAERLTLVATVSGTTVTLVAGLLVIPSSGVIGAAVVTVAGIVVTNLINLVSARIRLGITTVAGP